MSSNLLDRLVDELSDILPSLTRSQVEKLNELMDNDDYDGVRFALSFYAKMYREPVSNDLFLDEDYDRQAWASEESHKHDE